MHRIGGLEKADGTGNVEYDPDNHDHMCRVRAAKVAGVTQDIPPLEVDDPDGASLLVLGWGSTWGVIKAGIRRIRQRGGKAAQAHLTHLNPFPADLGEVLARYDQVLVPEMNLGQLSRLIRAEYLVDAVGLNQVRGIPFRAAEIEAQILTMLDLEMID
jgi:2-oxoglutarate ferredoxin oxidoreductase subunit alpha